MDGEKNGATSFRQEVFRLCKKLQKNETAQKVKSVIYNLSVSVESKETGTIKKNAHGDFSYVAQHSNTEFHGYLFLDDSIGEIDLPKILSVNHLSSEERLLIERGHRTLTRFVELCLSDIEEKAHVVAESMNPYFLYREVNVSEMIEPIVSDEELLPAVIAFKSGDVYKMLLASNFTKLFEKIDISSMRVLVGTVEKEVNQSLDENETKDLKEFSLRLVSKLNNITDIMFAFSILMFALKKSLELSCRLFYRAICGVDLFVLNEENIINIEKATTNTICKFYKVFAQDLPFDYTRSEMGSILLIDCDTPYGSHIHEFGMVIAETINLLGELGQTAKYSFVTVNEELIHIHEITGEILKVGLPTVEATQ